MKKSVVEKIIRRYWETCLVAIIGGFGWLIWALCRPGFSIGETLLAEVVLFGVVGICCALSGAAAGAIPVRIVNPPDNWKQV